MPLQQPQVMYFMTSNGVVTPAYVNQPILGFQPGLQQVSAAPYMYPVAGAPLSVGASSAAALTPGLAQPMHLGGAGLMPAPLVNLAHPAPSPQLPLSPRAASRSAQQQHLNLVKGPAHGHVLHSDRGGGRGRPGDDRKSRDPHAAALGNGSGGGRGRRGGDRDREARRGLPNGSGDCGDSSGTNSLVAEFRSLNNHAREEWTLERISGNILAFCTDQYGSRFIQEKLAMRATTEAALWQVFREIEAEIDTLMKDVFGNYVIQKLFEFGPVSLRTELTSHVKGRVTELSSHMYGCRVIQKALEFATQQDALELIAELNCDGIATATLDQNANHVVQKALQITRQIADSMPGESDVLFARMQYMVDAVTGRGGGTSEALLTTCRHKYGCRVVQRTLEYCLSGQKAPILDQLVAAFDTLVWHEYGNYVMQHVLIHGRTQDQKAICEAVAATLEAVSRHKYASNVVEQCLKDAPSELCTALIDTFLETAFVAPDGGSQDCPIISLAKNQFGNYVIQRMMDKCSERQTTFMVAGLQPYLHTLRNSPYAKQIIARVERSGAASA